MTIADIVESMQKREIGYVLVEGIELFPRYCKVCGKSVQSIMKPCASAWRANEMAVVKTRYLEFAAAGEPEKILFILCWACAHLAEKEQNARAER